MCAAVCGGVRAAGVRGIYKREEKSREPPKRQGPQAGQATRPANADTHTHTTRTLFFRTPPPTPHPVHVGDLALELHGVLVM